MSSSSVETNRVAGARPVPQFAVTPRGAVEYASRGEGPAVLALHGAMGGWDQADLLARTVGGPGYRYICLSRPGYLGTPLALAVRPEEQADLYADVLDALGIADAAVMAVSGGGPGAIHFALRHPDRCRGLVLISTCGQKVQERLPLAFHLMRVFARWPWLLERMRRKASGNLEENLRRSISDPATLERVLSDAEVRPLLEELTMMSFGRMAQRLAGTINDVTVTRTREYPLEEVAVPVLIVHGTKDPLVPFELHGQVLAARIPGAALLAAEGGEHVAIFTHRALVQARVTQFLRELA